MTFSTEIDPFYEGALVEHAAATACREARLIELLEIDATMALGRSEELRMVALEIAAACMTCLDRFMDAVNSGDVLAMEREMHFPHARIADDTVVTYAVPGMNPLDLFQRLRRDDGWHRSHWLAKRMIQGDARKVHVAVRYARLRQDGSVIGAYDSLYILTQRGGRWGIQARSSFGP